MTTPNKEAAEREAFEKDANDARFFPAELDFSRTKSPSGRDEYANTHLQSRWEGWLARSALTAPEAAAQPVDLEEQAASLIHMVQHGATQADVEAFLLFRPAAVAREAQEPGERVHAIAALQNRFGVYEAQPDSLTRKVARNAALRAISFFAAPAEAGGMTEAEIMKLFDSIPNNPLNGVSPAFAPVIVQFARAIEARRRK